MGQFVLIWLKQAQAHRVIKRIVSSARPQYRSVAHLTLRDVPLQIGSILLLCELCWYVEFKIVAVVVFVSVLVSELCLHMILRRQSLFRLIETDRAILFAMILCALNTVLYLLPALFLVRAPSLAMKITGMIWIMGVQVYLANTWSRVPTFLCVMVVPAMAMMVIAFFMLRHAAPVMSSMTEWGIAVGFLALFLYSTIDALRQHLSMEADLAKAQQESAQRLAKLEESDRLDALTGSLNRRAFDVALGVMLEDRKLTGGEITVFLVDLDSFKPINDTYSHEAGDEVLIQTADRLRAIIAQSGIVGRLGGDEFVCALHDLENAEDDMACGAPSGGRYCETDQVERPDLENCGQHRRGIQPRRGEPDRIDPVFSGGSGNGCRQIIPQWWADFVRSPSVCPANDARGQTIAGRKHRGPFRQAVLSTKSASADRPHHRVRSLGTVGPFNGSCAPTGRFSRPNR